MSTLLSKLQNSLNAKVGFSQWENDQVNIKKLNSDEQLL